MAATTAGEMKRSLSLTGITVNAMALIAPGAFLWTTFELQSAQVAGKSSTAPEMWTGLLFALVLALFTAYSYSELARIYPDAGTGSSYYFAEAALLDKDSPSLRKWSRPAKLTLGWISHLYYWLYPGIMVAFTGTLFGYIYATVFHHTLTYVPLAAVCVVFAFVSGYIAVRGVSGSTMTAIVINVIQIVALVAVSIIFIGFRMKHGDLAYEAANAGTVIIPHNFLHVIYQSTIAILLLVGFESVTALGAEAINPEKDIRRGILLSLIIQGGICYLFEYFAANFAVGGATIANSQRHRLRGGGHRPGPDRHDAAHHRREDARSHGHHGVVARGVHGAARPDRDDAGVPQHGRPRHVRHGQGQGDAEHPRPPARRVRHAPWRHLDPGGVLRPRRHLRRATGTGRQHHPDHPGLERRHVPRVRPDLPDRAGRLRPPARQARHQALRRPLASVAS